MREIGPLEALRTVAKEFDGVGDDEVCLWLMLTEPLVSKRRFKKMWAQALALLTAHRMKMAGVGAEDGEDPLSEIGKIGAGSLARVSSFSEGQTSISFGGDSARLGELNAELALTHYGTQYLTMLRMWIMPITSAGENVGRP